MGSTILAVDGVVGVVAGAAAAAVISGPAVAAGATGAAGAASGFGAVGKETELVVGGVDVGWGVLAVGGVGAVGGGV